MSNTSTVAKKSKNPVMPEVKSSAPTAILTSQSLIAELWSRAQVTMNQEEIEWFSYSGEQASSMSMNLREVIRGIGGLIADDRNTRLFQSKDDVAILLWSIEQSLATIEAMHDIGMEADYLLKKSNAGGAA